MTSVSTKKDRYGLLLTTSSANSADSYVEGLDLLLEQGYGADEKFQQAIEWDPGFAIALSGLAIMELLQGKTSQALERSKNAIQLAKSATMREQRHCKIVDHFVSGKGTDALSLLKEQLNEYPLDALMLRLANRLYMLGCSGAGVTNFPNELFALLQGIESDYGNDWAFQGQYAFAHHEMGMLSESLDLAEKSLLSRPTSGWASHSVAHVYFETGNHITGGEFLGSWLEGYDKRAPFHVHLSWHQALFELAQGRHLNATRIYEEDIRPSVKERSAMSLQDSASLAWRMKIYEGYNPSFNVEEIKDQAAPAADTPGPAFRDAHAALAFCVAGNTELSNKLTSRLIELSNTGDSLVREITLPLVRGIDAFASKSYDDAVNYLEPVFPQLARIGGSHAQREVFEDTLLAAYLFSGQYEKGQEMLDSRLKKRASVRDSFWLGKLQSETNQNAIAASNLESVRNRWNDADSNSQETRTLSQLL